MTTRTHHLRRRIGQHTHKGERNVATKVKETVGNNGVPRLAVGEVETGGGQLVSAETQTPKMIVWPAAGDTLASALAAAQARCKVALCDGVNAGKGCKPYATADSILRVANEALRDSGLVTLMLGNAPLNQAEVSNMGKEWLMCAFKFELQHVGSGEVKQFTFTLPILFEKGRSVEDSFAIAFTRAHTIFLRTMLRVEKEQKTAVPPGGGEQARQERLRLAAEAQQKQQVQPASVEVKPLPITVITQGEISAAYGEYFACREITDDAAKKVEWTALLGGVKAGCTSARQMTEEEAGKFLAVVRAKIAFFRNPEPQTLQAALTAEVAAKEGDNFPGNG